MAASEAVGLQVAVLKEQNTSKSLQQVEDRLQIVKELLAAGADAKCEDCAGFQPIHACLLSTVYAGASKIAKTYDRVGQDQYLRR